MSKENNTNTPNKDQSQEKKERLRLRVEDFVPFNALEEYPGNFQVH